MYRCLRRLYRYSLLNGRGLVISTMRKFNQGYEKLYIYIVVLYSYFIISTTIFSRYEYEMITINGEKVMVLVTNVEKELQVIAF